MLQLTEREYYEIAYAALAHYPIELEGLHFIQHNAGITFRVDSRMAAQDGRHSFLLKIHAPVGNIESASPELISARYVWLRALGQNSDLVVQMPIPNRQGELLTAVTGSKGRPPYTCTLQQWVEGDWPGGDYTAAQVQQIGALMARLHHFSSEWDQMGIFVNALPVYEPSDLKQAVQTLYLAVDAGLLSQDDFRLVESASKIVIDVIRKVGRGREHWGPTYLSRNLRQLVDEFCQNFVTGTPILHLSPKAE